ncbi:MAG: Actin-like protein arp9 (SWI/SNF complex component arp9) [Chrysothrix sp. TS-e1954]|nr:MAG: Actin-like protein arp9 (SWI/SNF complex component arp9) [Chrysothrix sp. TS-e1954]
MPNFKDEHIIIIAPGSQTTLAQLGLPESFTPPRLRVKSRMFRAEREGEWEPYRVRKKQKAQNASTNLSGASTAAKGEDGAEREPIALPVPSEANAEQDNVEDTTFEEDYTSDEGAVWPIKAGKVVNWPCFYALMQHVHNALNAPFHTPILLISQPCWTSKDHEQMTAFFFEKFKAPGFALLDASQAITYAYGLQTACVVDVGRDKADVTAITEFLVNEVGRSSAVLDCGGEAMTQTLLEALRSRGWTRDMCEQLKKNAICEILPPGVALPQNHPVNQQQLPAVNPAAQASTGAEGSGPDQRQTLGAQGSAPRGPGQGTEVGPENNGKDELEDNEGVLDVASIVTSGNMTDYLAKKEQEKRERAEKAAIRRNKAAAGDQAAKDAMAKPIRKRNSEKEKTTFYYEDHALLDVLKDDKGMDTQGLADAKAALDEGPAQRKLSLDTTSASQSATDAQQQPPPSATSPTSPTSPSITKTSQSQNSSIRRELTVGHERFMPLSNAQLANLTSAIYLTISAIPSTSQRTSLWENLIITGSGAKVRGFKEAILNALNARFLISPSSATMFTSELPSSFSSTPIGTPGTQTPVPHGHGPMGAAGQPAGVNPLLHAATTTHAFQQAQHHPHTPGQHLAPPQTPHRPLQHPHPHPQSVGHGHNQTYTQSHSQTPTSIRSPKLPEYFSEWRAAGPDSDAEAVFLGAQVAAKLVFMTDTGSIAAPSYTGSLGQGGYNNAGQSNVQAKAYMSRGDYNEMGPTAISEFVF